MRLMTFNILYGTAPAPTGGWSARRKLVADVIGLWAPDIAGLQEAMAEQLSDLSSDLPEYHVVSGPASGQNRLRGLAGRVRPTFGSARNLLYGQLKRSSHHHERHVAGTHPRRVADPPGSVPRTGESRHTADRGEHCAILFRKDRFRLAASGAFWLSARPELPGSLLWGTWQPRVVHWARLEEIRGGEVVTLYNAHMDYLPWAPRRSAIILRSHLDRDFDGTPQFLVGDMNTPTRSAAIRGLLRSGPGTPHAPPLQDAWVEAAHREGPVQTLHRGTGRGSWPGRIDHILFRPRMTVERISTVTHREGRVYPSDHFPVVAELRRESPHPG